MKKTILTVCITFGIVVLIVVGYGSKIRNNGSQAVEKEGLLGQAAVENKTMKLESTDFSNGELIPSKFTCDGEGINPELMIAGVPPETMSLVLMVDDPDAPTGNFNHWVVWNIPSNTEKIGESSLPEGAAVGVNDGGKVGYLGPCPPSGMHRYYFKLYALDTKLNLPANSRKDDVERAITGHIIDEAELLGKYTRK